MENTIGSTRGVARARLPVSLPALGTPTLVWVVLLALTVGAFLLWASLDRGRDVRQTELGQALAQVQQERRDLTKVLVDMGPLQERERHSQAGLTAEQVRLVGSAERVMVVDLLMDMVLRIGLSPRTLLVGGTKGIAFQGQSLQVLQMSLVVTGSRPDVLELVEALQSGMVPALGLQQLQVQAQTDDLTATLALELYTWPTQEPRFAIPAALLPVGPAAEPSAGALAVGARVAPVLTWKVQGRGMWTDALRGATFTHQAPAGSIGVFMLYAEATGDDTLDPFADHLLAQVSPGADGWVVMAPPEPYTFASEQGQRFYLAVQVYPQAPITEGLEVSVVPGDIVFTSTAWPTAEGADAFHVWLPFRLAPTAGDLRAEVDAGRREVIALQGHTYQGPLDFRIVVPPQHGWLAEEFPVVVYLADAEFEGEDTFTYVATDGVLDSAPATVRVRVLRPNTPPEVADMAVALNLGGPTLVAPEAYDAEGDPVYYSVVGWPRYGQLQDQPGGWTYTPTGPAVEDSFTYRASDGRAAGPVATVGLRVPDGMPRGELLEP